MGWELAGLDAAWLIGPAGKWVLVWARVLGLCLTAPGLAVPALAWQFRIGLAAVLGAVLAPVVTPQVILPADGPAAVWTGLAEVFTGGVLGWSAGLIVAAARTAGDLVAAQAGLATATLFDPESGDEQTPLGQLYGWLALAVFLAMDGPMALVRALVDSYATFPLGGLVSSPQARAFAFGQVGHALELALCIAAPPAIALVMTGIVLGWLSRAAPSLPFLALALPIRAGLGMALIVLSMTVLVVTLASSWSTLP
jgi:flagellar biosynthetic protein FliR